MGVVENWSGWSGRLAEMFLKVSVASPPKWFNVHIFQNAKTNSTKFTRRESFFSTFSYAVKMGKVRQQPHITVIMKTT